MFRTARRITPSLSSLVLASGVALAAGGIMGCDDENEPASYVKKLSDPATRAPAVNRLIQFYEDKSTQDQRDKGVACTSDTETAVCQSRVCGDDKTCKLQIAPLLELIVPPMTERCVAGDLDERTNSKLIKFLSDTHDPKAEPCIVKALKDYKPDNTEDDVRSAVRAVAAMKLKSAAGPLMDVFTKIHASKPKAQSTYLDVANAMEAIQDPSWEPQLVAYLGRPIDPKDQAALTDEMFWQITSAKILGEMKSASAVKPLIKLILSPQKAAGQMTAILALIKIGKPAVGPTVALLKGEDKDLVEYSKGEALKTANGDKNAEKAAGTAYVGSAALILATIGREETGAPLIDAIDKSDDVPRAIIARELTKIPKSPATVKAFQTAFEKTPPNASIPPGGGAREALLEASDSFYDASFVPWILKAAKDMKGSDEDLEPIREASLLAALKVATTDQLKLVDELAAAKTTADGKTSTVGKGFEKEYKMATAVLTACGDKLDCYLGKLADPASQAEGTQFTGIKSAYMIGELGNADTRQKLLDLMPKLTNPALRFMSVQLIDYFSPKGDTALAQKLQKMVDDAEASKDSDKIRATAPFKTVIYRLNARAQ